MSMAARLKTFVTSDGMTDYVVATSSRAKALAAWGVRQDLFKEGRAYETNDPALIRAAAAQPGEVLRKPAGMRGNLEKLKVARPARPAGPTKKQLKAVEMLKAKLAALARNHESVVHKIERERSRLDDKSRVLDERYDTERAKLEAALKAAEG